MKEDQLTPWFPAEVKPVHVGIYEVKLPWFGHYFFSFWDGRFWRHTDENREILAKQFRQWRGLRSKP